MYCIAQEATSAGGESREGKYGLCLCYLHECCTAGRCLPEPRHESENGGCLQRYREIGARTGCWQLNCHWLLVGRQTTAKAPVDTAHTIFDRVYVYVCRLPLREQCSNVLVPPPRRKFNWDFSDRRIFFRPYSRTPSPAAAAATTATLRFPELDSIRFYLENRPGKFLGTWGGGWRGPSSRAEPPVLA
jgi:hypothetical protein